MKQRRESIEVAEILSLVAQLEEKYREKRKRKPSRGSLCLVLQLEKRTITEGPKEGKRKKSIREQQILYLVLKQRRESIEVAEILSLVPQLEEKYSSLE